MGTFVVGPHKFTSLMWHLLNQPVTIRSPVVGFDGLNVTNKYIG